LTDDAIARQRLEEMALSFAERIGGSEDLDIAETFAAARPSNQHS
jgi:hypothetical protein